MSVHVIPQRAAKSGRRLFTFRRPFNYLLLTAIRDVRPTATVAIAPQRAELVSGHTVAAGTWSVQSLVRWDGRCLPRARPANTFSRSAGHGRSLWSRASNLDSQHMVGHPHVLRGDVSRGRARRRRTGSQTSGADRKERQTWRSAAQGPKRRPRRQGRVVKQLGRATASSRWPSRGSAEVGSYPPNAPERARGHFFLGVLAPNPSSTPRSTVGLQPSMP
jgi:hypothetical protein